MMRGCLVIPDLPAVYNVASYGNCDVARAMGMPYDARRTPNAHFHVDHTIPRAALREKALRKRGMPGALIVRTRASANRLGNIQLLIDRKDLGKSDGDFAAWLRTRDESFLEQHLIPNDPELWQPEAFLDFVEAREGLMRDALKRFLIVNEVGVGS